MLGNITELRVSKLFSWLSRVQCRRGSFYIVLDKKVARGLNLNRGDMVKSSLSQDNNNNPVIVVEFNSEI